MIRWTTFFILILTAITRAAEPRMLIISVDGLRPDCLLRADAPNIRSLINDGSFSFWATTTPVAITLPSHASMLTGVTVEKHGIAGNDDKAAAEEKLLVPSIFDLAHDAGITTGMATGKSKFSMFSKSIDHPWVPEKLATIDSDVGDHAVEIISKYQPRLMFVHFPGSDASGHSKGWGSPDQIATIEAIDRQIGRIFNSLNEAKLKDQTVILLSSDHGGMGRKHGSANALDPTNQSIPWIIAGPGIRRGIDLTLTNSNKIQTYDTFATACKIFGLKAPQGIDGKPVDAAFEGELMSPTTKPATQQSNSDGQNVLYADGHSSWDVQPWHGAEADNVYSGRAPSMTSQSQTDNQNSKIQHP